MNRLDKLINDFSVENLILFLRKVLEGKNFKPDNEELDHLFKEDIYDKYESIIKIGEAEIDKDDLIVIASKTNEQLTERTGKKNQYEIAKKILKHEVKDASLFVFYDNKGNFRFSFVKANYLGTKRDFTDFKRYTYFVSRKQTNKTFINQISKCDFNSLDSIQEAFSVEPVTKQFYEKLQRWYFWAINNVEFPKDAEQETNGREVAIIRLITRLMFIWFMKVRHLIPPELFKEENISKILKDFSAEESTYYKAILQNLFFATLNTEQKDREFRTEIRGAKGYNPDYGNHNVFRYQSLFNEPELLDKLFGEIPFLNGGLFECMDYKTKDKNERKYIDGFTAIKGQQPKVPNFLFFSKIEKVDISSFFGQKDKTYEVEGLLNLLNSYNFTIDENEPDDVEVALDPELLGSIFENLIASYNPETATTARKATGSFYTPREIVNYMTNESLKQYFITNLSEKNNNDTNARITKNIDSLINANNSENPFDEKTTKQIIKLINNLRVVDPAVGSGAFPMAMLNKLVFILGKLDPENKHWKQSQIDGIKKAVSDSVVQRKLIEQIERQFKEKNADYGRKLYLIEKCIYGVDIQYIAVEIAKLRFFISLLVDEKIDFDNSDNYGIEPLPNLDFKLMQGNSLISTYAGIDFNDNENIDLKIEKIKNQLTETENKQKEVQSDFLMIFNKENGREDKGLKNELIKLKKIENKLNTDLKELKKDSEKTQSEKHKKLIKEFEELKHQYQNEADHKTKKELRKEIDKAVIKIFEEKISTHFPQLKRIEENAKQFPKKKQQQKYISEEKQKLTKKLGFNIEQIEKDLTAYTEGRKEKDFFLWNVYFAEVFSEKDGFDVVIGNPPYIQLQKSISNNGNEKFADLYKNENYKTFERTGDIYALFYEKGLNILTDKGLLCYITSNKWMRANYGKSLRKFLSQHNPLKLIDMGPGVFNTATVDTNILLIANSIKSQNFVFQLKALTFSKHYKIDNLNDNDFITLTELSEDSWIILSPAEQNIKEKIERIGTPLKDWDINIYRGVLTGFNEAFIIDGKTKDELIAKDPKSAEIIKPILRGRDIKRYKAEFADLWLINTYNGYINSEGKRIPPINIDEYLTIKEHLDQYWDKLKKRQDKGKTPYNLRNCAYLEEFEKEKIVWGSVSETYYTFVENDTVLLDTNYFCVFSEKNINKYILAVLNSKLIIDYVNDKDTLVGLAAYRHYKYNFEKIPIPKISKANQKPFETLVDKIIAKKERGKDTTAEEQQIDIMVYKLYELTYDEVKIVDPEFALSQKGYENFKF